MLKKSRKQLIILAMILVVVFLAACQPAEIEPQVVEVTRVVQETVLVTQISEVIITATPEAVPPTQMPTTFPTMPANLPGQATSEAGSQQTVPAVPTQSGEQAANNDPAVTVASGVLSGYCMPEKSGSLIGAPTPSASMPAAGKPLTVVDGVTQIPSPMEVCTFVFDFGMPAAKGSKLEVYDVGQNSPWFTQSLMSASGNPNLSLAVVTHQFIINPPFWEIPYVFKVRSSDGTEQWSEQVLVKKWVPEKCWNGEYPDPVSLECPIEDS